MSSARSVNDWLEARDRRQEALIRALQEKNRETLLTLSLNIPGADKTPPGAERLFAWALKAVHKIGPFEVPCTLIAETRDALGYFALVRCAEAPLSAKQKAVALETSHPVARLLDIDVYRPSGEQIGRREIGLPARTCLLCDEAAVDCMRAKRHDPDEVIARAHELLKNFYA